ncbi:thioredoxin domain-containing protein [Pseudoduganella sp. DS3]|uniref:Thiol:disulfide interchange protein n=1 Tax=Pseudoduganella guangdongensis TaxID=2692179 RepID=A0A6N9HNF9_9BURK|nr:thiol:disulfide interchange protein DsbA/DsbL [Pseudoduganella guangdongensis]MYN05014.1 thioredoxin domain-containing protein [Pseudoduganella guangdongensis]
MRLLRLLLASAALMFTAAGASAADPKEGVDWRTLDTPVRSEAQGKKIEVVEFFMYSCPHCFVLEPRIAAWAKQNADKVHFRRLHFARGEKDVLARTYVTLEAMGLSETVSQKIFNAMHVDHKRLMREDEMFAFLASAGVDKAKFEAVYKSFGVESKMKRMAATIGQYKGIDSAPTLVVDGRYVTAPSMAGRPGQPESQQQAAALAVLDYLVAKSAATKK